MEPNLVYDDSIDIINIENVILIDKQVYDADIFYFSANTKTFPIKYSNNSTSEELINLLSSKFTKINRFALVMNNANYPYKMFLNNNGFFTDSDLENGITQFSENMETLINIINTFKIEHLDNLACKSLLYEKWVQYYNILTEKTSIIIGASNDETGNLKYSGNWIMESTNEDIQQIYFNSFIENYSSTLATLTISSDGGVINISQDTSGNIQYTTLTNQTPSIIPSTFWPVTITNSNPISSNVLNVYIQNNLSMYSAFNYFIIGSQYINIDGSNYTVTLNNVSSYLGFIQNGRLSNGFSNFTISNIGILSIGSTLYDGGCINGGWVCQANFSKNASNCYVNGCYSNGSINDAYSGGIVGCDSGGIVNSCYSTGNIGYGCGGIFGGKGYGTANNCYSTGNTTNYGAGGIFGGNSVGIANDCYSIGNILNAFSGGIFGGGCVGIANNCYSIGNITGGASGGIVGSSCSTIIKNCYTMGVLNGGNNGLYGVSFTGTTSNCYIANGVWSDTSANTVLQLNDTSGNAIWIDTYNTNTITPYLLASFNANLYSSLSNVMTYGTSSSSVSGLITGKTYKIVNPNTGISIDATTGIMSFSSIVSSGNYIINVICYLMSNGVTYAYNINQYSLTVNKATLNITADNKVIVINDPIPIFTYQTLGLVNNDNLSGNLEVNYGNGSIGIYDINIGTLNAGQNYNINYTKGNLTILDQNVNSENDLAQVIANATNNKKITIDKSILFINNDISYDLLTYNNVSNNQITTSTMKIENLPENAQVLLGYGDATLDKQIIESKQSILSFTFKVIQNNSLISTFSSPLTITLFLPNLNNAPIDVYRSINTGNEQVATNINGENNYYSFNLGNNSNYNITGTNTIDVCIGENAEILMYGGVRKKIKEIKRGDFVLSDIKTNTFKQVARVLYGYSTLQIVKIPKHTLNNYDDLYCTWSHPIWINNDNNRIRAICINGIEFEDTSMIVYNIQFEDEGTFYANGIKVDSLSPFIRNFPLTKSLFFNKNKYRENSFIHGENDIDRNKPFLIGESYSKIILNNHNKNK